MAGIDKIYLDWKDWLKFRHWLIQNKDKCMREIQYDLTYVIEQDIPERCMYYPVSNFPCRVDYWLMKNCPLGPIIDRLCQQYGEDEVMKRQGKNNKRRTDRRIRYQRR